MIKEVIFAAAIMGFPTLSVAENTWNIMTSEAADEISRSAGAEVLTGAISVFEALKLSEERQYELSAESLREAALAYEQAATQLEELGFLEEAFIILPVNDLSTDSLRAFYLWYTSFSSDPSLAVGVLWPPNQEVFEQNLRDIPDIFTADFPRTEVETFFNQIEFTASDVLLTAALHCRAMSNDLLSVESEGGIPTTRSVPPERLAVLTSQAAALVTIGNIATQLFNQLEFR